MLDTIMLSLRLSDGLHMPSFTEQFGEEAAARVMSVATRCQQQGILQCIGKRDLLGDGSCLPITIRLKDPEGFLLSNDIISDFFAELTMTSTTAFLL